MSNKRNRRYLHHQEKHRWYFEALARQMVAEREATIELGGGVFEARLREGNGWLDIRESGGSWDNNTSIAGLDGEALVSCITDELIAKAAEFRGVEIPPFQRG